MCLFAEASAEPSTLPSCSKRLNLAQFIDYSIYLSRFFLRPMFTRSEEIIIGARRDRSTELSLEGLGLSSLPEQIADLDDLISLNLSSNLLTTVPERIGNIANLTTLDLNENRLNTLPESLLNSPEGLQRNINLEHNPISPDESARLGEIALAREVSLELGDSDARTEPRATTTPSGGLPFVGGGSLEQGSPRLP
jgi:Leucine-rich repeat (LRR) protein